MIEVDIPEFGIVSIQHLVSDFTGTLSVDGWLIGGAREQFQTLAAKVFKSLAICLYWLWHVSFSLQS